MADRRNARTSSLYKQSQTQATAAPGRAAFCFHGAPSLQHQKLRCWRNRLKRRLGFAGLGRRLGCAPALAGLPGRRAAHWSAGGGRRRGRRRRGRRWRTRWGGRRARGYYALLAAVGARPLRVDAVVVRRLCARGAPLAPLLGVPPVQPRHPRRVTPNPAGAPRRQRRASGGGTLLGEAHELASHHWHPRR